jgi:hypothetical protein
LYLLGLWNVIPFLINQVSVMISFVSVVSKHGSFENWYQTFDVCCHWEILDANRSSDQTWMVVASWARRVGVAASPRSYRVQVHKQVCVCPHVEEVHARKWKLDAPTQDTAFKACSFYLPCKFLRAKFQPPEYIAWTSLCHRIYATSLMSLRLQYKRTWTVNVCHASDKRKLSLKTMGQCHSKRSPQKIKLTDSREGEARLASIQKYCNHYDQ